MTTRHDVVVIGGGLSGLLMGVELRRRGLDAVVLEAAPSPGGVANTIQEDGYLLEPAAGTLLLPHPDLSPILDAAEVELTEAPEAARRRWVYRHGRLIEAKDSPAIMVSPLLSARAKLRAIREPWAATPPSGVDESLLQFTERRFGPELGRLLATIMAHGVFAGDPAVMSARGAFPKLVTLEDEAGSVIKGGIRRLKQRPKASPRARAHFAPGGMLSVAQGLASSLGSLLRLSWRVDKIAKTAQGWEVHGPDELVAQSVIVALEPSAAAPLVPTEVSDALQSACTSPVAIVGLGGRAADVPLLPGFGFLTGPDEDMHALGMLFESEYATGRAPNGHRLVKAIYGGGADPEVMSRSDADLVALATRELGQALGIVVSPTWTRVARHAPGIPQYGIGHPQWLSQLDTALVPHPGLHLAGWGYRGIGVSSLASDAVRLADQITAGALDTANQQPPLPPVPAAEPWPGASSW